MYESERKRSLIRRHENGARVRTCVPVPFDRRLFERLFKIDGKTRPKRVKKKTNALTDHRKKKKRKKLKNGEEKPGDEEERKQRSKKNRVMYHYDERTFCHILMGPAR